MKLPILTAAEGASWEAGLLVALLVPTDNPILAWIGVACMGWALAAGVRWPVLFERPEAPSQGVA